jgi:hypothetical protein
MEHKTGCLLCGAELVYLLQTETLTCQFCRQSFSADVRCANGHYICDTCHSQSADGFILQQCLASQTTDPFALAVELMDSPFVKMHGPEHHFLVPAVLLTAYYSESGEPEQKAKKLTQARQRAEKVPGGFCGSHGNCGAAVGTGIFISLVTGSTPLAKREWQLSNLMTARSLLVIANHGGPRCCKRNSFLALGEAVDFIAEQFGVQLDGSAEIACHFSPLNGECRGVECPYFAGSDSEKRE